MLYAFEATNPHRIRKVSRSRSRFSSRPAPLLRFAAFLTTLLFVWMSLLALPISAAAQALAKPTVVTPKPIPTPKSIPTPPAHDDPAWHTIDYSKPRYTVPVAKSGQPLHLVEAPNFSLLNEVGRLAHPIPADMVADWKAQLHLLKSQSLPAGEIAKRHVWLGEYTLAHDEQPEQALWHFNQAQRYSKRQDIAYGLAAEDKAITAFFLGAYLQAAAEFDHVLRARPALRGFDRRTCTSLLRHARACAGYHAERLALGIPEPIKLDPLCGVSAIAVALKAASKPYDKARLLANLRITGRGSNHAGFSGTALNWDVNDNLYAFGNVLTAGYNADGLRAWKQTAAGRTYFLYNGLMPVCEVDGNGNVTAVNTWGATGLLARFVSGTGGGSVFYCFDPQGSASVRLDNGANILSSHTNEAWGTQISTVATNDPYAGYGGQWGYYKDVETGLHLLGERYYDTSSGRFLNRDPIGYDGGINMYAYAEGNPVTGIDPEGFSVTVIFDRKAGTVTVTDDDDKSKTATICGVWSGNGVSANDPAASGKAGVGPIPGGTYYLDQGSQDTHMGWRYRIYVPKKGGGWTYNNDPEIMIGKQKIHRGNFNLHAGRASDGCVTVRSDIEPLALNYPGWSTWDKIRNIIDKTKPITIKGSKGKFAGKIIVN